MHLNDRFPNHRGTKEGPERDQEVTTGDPGQIKERVWD